MLALKTVRGKRKKSRDIETQRQHPGNRKTNTKKIILLFLAQTHLR
jgi:hypothetical protein